MIPNPWLILAAVIFLLVSHTWAFHEGKQFESNARDAAQLEATNKAIEQADQQAIDDNKLAGEEVKIQEKIKIEYRYIREKVNAEIEKNPTYTECGLGDIGLQLFNAAPNTKADIAGKSFD